MGFKICDACRKKLGKQTTVRESDTESDEQTKSRAEVYVDTSEAISSINQCLTEIGVPRFVKSKVQRRHYRHEKVRKVTEAMKRVVLTDVEDDECTDNDEIIVQLKAKFMSTKSRREQLQILTILPQSWALKRIQSEFQTSNYMARKSKQLVKEKGILSTPDPKPGPSLPCSTVDCVRSFYESDDISRVMPGRRILCL